MANVVTDSGEGRCFL